MTKIVHFPRTLSKLLDVIVSKPRVTLLLGVILLFLLMVSLIVYENLNVKQLFYAAIALFGAILSLKLIFILAAYKFFYGKEFSGSLLLASMIIAILVVFSANLVAMIASIHIIPIVLFGFYFALTFCLFVIFKITPLFL